MSAMLGIRAARMGVVEPRMDRAHRPSAAPSPAALRLRSRPSRLRLVVRRAAPGEPQPTGGSDDRTERATAASEAADKALDEIEKGDDSGPVREEWVSSHTLYVGTCPIWPSLSCLSTPPNQALLVSSGSTLRGVGGSCSVVGCTAIRRQSPLTHANNRSLVAGDHMYQSLQDLRPLCSLKELGIV